MSLQNLMLDLEGRISFSLFRSPKHVLSHRILAIHQIFDAKQKTVWSICLISQVRKCSWLLVERILQLTSCADDGGGTCLNCAPAWLKYWYIAFSWMLIGDQLLSAYGRQCFVFVIMMCWASGGVASNNPPHVLYMGISHPLWVVKLLPSQTQWLIDWVGV